MVKLIFFQFRVTDTNSMVKLIFFQFRVTDLHFELQFRLVLEIQFYLCPVPFGGYQEKLVHFFGHTLNQIIFTS